ncbi:MAG: NADH-quinone oxidoreductase subunit H [Candidatus Tectomicrobia bacterium]|uniref:NADH-quinone oxidoreductase subunit H n=1 Tax=Tectimicrobiota bacterium TaxID=2528274 RepID=A0A932HYP6_UNCTE|nr:NADH-quinone oxidoreductase subunit H [Candidatus Tectomicrobia bacterium]
MTARLLHPVVFLLGAPLLLGVVVKVKALAAGRKGAPLLQLYFDIWRLLRKEMVLSRTTTWVFLAGPAAGLASVVLAGLFIPVGRVEAPLGFTGDFILFAYLLALGRFFTAAAALDTGSAFEGMGAVREVTFACFTELALFFSLIVLARLSGSLNLSRMILAAGSGPIPAARVALLLVAASVFLVLLAENCRIPFDDPNTHLELTMIHEVMVLDHSGPALGAVLYGAALKFFLFSSLVAGLLASALPLGGAWGWGLYAALLAAVAVLVGVVESVMARLRLVHVPRLLIGGGLLAAFALLLAVKDMP